MADRRNKVLRVACLQVNASDDWKKNLRRSQKKVRLAVRRGAQLIALPENFCWRGSSQELSFQAAKATPQILKEYKKLARDLKVAILLGSVIEGSPKRRKYFNTSFLISGRGKIIARYRKIHLFDSFLKGARTRESRHIISGNRVVTAEVSGIRAGLAICYDLRFPELFRELSRRGARMIFLPANFTFETGKAHWEILLRARAIENQVFIVAPAQVGVNPASGIRSFGRSLILDPWGRILARGSQSREEVIAAGLQLKMQESLRKKMPVLKHRRLD